MTQSTQRECVEGNTNSSTHGTKKKDSRHRNWFFTYNNYTNSDIDTIIKHFSINTIAYVFQEECEKTPHLQGVVKYKYAKPFSYVKKISDRIHWEPCHSWDASVEYCSDKTKRRGKIWSMNCKLKYEPYDVLEHKELYNWQSKIINLINMTFSVSDRTINWYYEPKGNTGKTTLAKHLCLKYGAIYITGKSADCKYAIKNYIENKGPPKIVIFDFTRSQEDFISYQSIEEVKNGIFFNTKYESEMVIYDSPHVICFANFPPHKDRLSEDRWNIINISDS